MEFSKRLKGLRLSSGSPQSQIAKAAGVSTTQYQNYEYGKSEPTAAVLVALAEYFDVSVDFLLGKTDDSKSAVAVAVPKEYHHQVIVALEELGISRSQLKQESHRACVIGEGFIVDDLTPSEAEKVAKTIASLLDKYLVGRSDDNANR